MTTEERLMYFITGAGLVAIVSGMILMLIHQ